MLWTFTPSLRDTNLPRNVKFLPLLFETLNYLAGAAEEQAQLIVGASVPAIPIQEMDAENWLMLKPGENEVLSITNHDTISTQHTIHHAGFLSLKPEQAEHWQWIQAVNPDTSESSQLPVDLEEFQWKLCSAPVSVQQSDGFPGENVITGSNQKTYIEEYGLWLLALLFVSCWLNWHMLVFQINIMPEAKLTKELLCIGINIPTNPSNHPHGGKPVRSINLFGSGFASV